MGSEHVLTCSRVKRGTSHSLKSGREIVTKCSWLKSGGVHMLLSVEKGQDRNLCLPRCCVPSSPRDRQKSSVRSGLVLEFSAHPEREEAQEGRCRGEWGWGSFLLLDCDKRGSSLALWSQLDT